MTHSSEWLRREPFIIGSLIVASSAFFVLTLTVSNAFRREKADLTQAFEGEAVLPWHRLALTLLWKISGQRCCTNPMTTTCDSS